MADSASNIRQMAIGQAGKEALVNALVDAATPSTLFGADWVGSSALTLIVFGGKVLVGGALTTLANQTLSLTASQTNYIEFDPTDTGTASGIKVNTSAFTAGRIPLWSVVCSASAINSWTDCRTWGAPVNPRLVVNMASDANKTLTQAEASVDILELTSTTLTATRDVVLPLIPMQWTVFNNTTGGQSLQFIGATGTGITVANAKRAILYADGTNIVRVTADNP